MKNCGTLIGPYIYFFGSEIELSVRVVTVLNLCWLTKCLVCKGIIEAQGASTQ